MFFSPSEKEAGFGALCNPEVDQSNHKSPKSRARWENWAGEPTLGNENGRQIKKGGKLVLNGRLNVLDERDVSLWKGCQHDERDESSPISIPKCSPSPAQWCSRPRLFFGCSSNRLLLSVCVWPFETEERNVVKGGTFRIPENWSACQALSGSAPRTDTLLIFLPLIHFRLFQGRKDPHVWQQKPRRT